MCQVKNITKLAATYIMQTPKFNAVSQVDHHNDFHPFCNRHGIGLANDGDDSVNSADRTELGEALRQLQKEARKPQAADESPIVAILRARHPVKIEKRLELEQILVVMREIVSDLERAKKHITEGGFKSIQGKWYPTDTSRHDKHDEVQNCTSETSYEALLHSTTDGLEHTHIEGCRYWEDNNEQSDAPFTCEKCRRYIAGYEFVEQINQVVLDRLA